MYVEEEAAVFGLIRVFLVSNNSEFRRRTTRLLRTDERFIIVGEAADGSHANPLAAQLRPDLVLLDVDFPEENGYAVALGVHDSSPESKIVFLSAEESVGALEAALAAGASGYVVKACVATELIPALLAIRDGEEFISSRVQRHTRSGDRDEPPQR